MALGSKNNLQTQKCSLCRNIVNKNVAYQSLQGTMKTFRRKFIVFSIELHRGEEMRMHELSTQSKKKLGRASDNNHRGKPGEMQKKIKHKS